MDYRRLNKQISEGVQILAALRTNRVGGGSLPRGWTRHPATLMWTGHDSALGVYLAFCLDEWLRRGYNNTRVLPYSHETFLRCEGWPDRDAFCPDGRDAELPVWWGDERVHKSHRAALMVKDPEHYRQFGWRVVPQIDYHWPVASDPEYTPGPVSRSGALAALDAERSKRRGELRNE